MTSYKIHIIVTFSEELNFNNKELCTKYVATLSQNTPNKVKENNNKIKYTYLKADLIAGLFGIAFDSVGRSHCWRVNGTIVSNYESVTSVVQLQPIKNGTTCDDRARQGGETMQIAG